MKIFSQTPRTWRYPIVWGTSRIIDVTVTALVIILAGAEQYRLALMFGLLADGAVDFIGLRRWVFKEDKRHRPLFQELAWYSFVRGSSAIVSILIAEIVTGKTFDIEFIAVYLLVSPTLWLVQLAGHRWFFIGKIRDFPHLMWEKICTVYEFARTLLQRVRNL